jgi:hypothetical protein
MPNDNQRNPSDGTKGRVTTPPPKVIPNNGRLTSPPPPKPATPKKGS